MEVLVAVDGCIESVVLNQNSRDAKACMESVYQSSGEQFCL